jgi:triosephosphate isomerase
MPKILIAGNWKMNKTEVEALSLVRVLMQRQESFPNVEVLICPPYTSLSQLHKLLVASPIMLGVQNISHQLDGAYTGEISGRMAAEFCSHVILGHSERRAYYGETDQLINLKIKAAQKAGLIPILCLGEDLNQKESGQTAAVINQQIEACLSRVQLVNPEHLIIAYEPVWAIGSGLTASPEETSQLIAQSIRPRLERYWGSEIASRVRVLYGGSVKAENAAGFFKQPEINGALVGGASLSAENFLGIIHKAH